MMNVMRAEVYRLLRSRSFYIVVGLLLGFFIVVELMLPMRMAWFGRGGPWDDWQDVIWTGTVHNAGDWVLAQDLPQGGVAYALMVSMAFGSMGGFVLLPLLLVAAGGMFTFGTVKNDMTSGISRTKLYLCKLMVSSALLTCMMAVLTVIYLLMGAVWGGYAHAPDGFWQDFVRVVVSQWFVLMALNSVGMFMLFAVRRVAVAAGVFLAAYIAVPMLLQMLMERIPAWGWLRFLDLYGLPGAPVVFDDSRLGAIGGWLGPLVMQTAPLHALAAAAVWLVLSTAGGLYLFRRAELK